MIRESLHINVEGPKATLNLKKIIVYITLFYIANITLLSSCNEIDKNLLYSQEIGKRVIINTDSIKLLNNSIININLNSKPKIFLVFKMGCPSCIDAIIKWSEIHRDNIYIRKADLIVLLTGEFSEYTNYHLFEINSLDFPIYWDKNDVFIKTNNISFLDIESCLLINTKSEIVYIGFPLINTKDFQRFINILKKY